MASPSKKTGSDKNRKAEPRADAPAPMNPDREYEHAMDSEQPYIREPMNDERNDSAPTPDDVDNDEDLPEMVPAVDVQALIQERDALKDQLLRSRAEFDNYRKRVARDAERARQRAAESLVRDLLPVVDNLELALQHTDAEHPLAEGVAMVVRQFQEALRRAGVEPIPALGQAFDPAVHEAVMHAPSADVAENDVAHEFQRGYRMGDFVLRPAKVAVSKGSPETTPEAGDGR